MLEVYINIADMSEKIKNNNKSFILIIGQVLITVF